MTELLEYKDWSLELLIFAILLEPDILSERAPPYLSFSKERRLFERFYFRFDEMPFFVVLHRL